MSDRFFHSEPFKSRWHQGPVCSNYTLFFMCSMQTSSIPRIWPILSIHTFAAWSKQPPLLAWIVVSLTCPCLHPHFPRTYHQYSDVCDLFNSKSYYVTHSSKSSSDAPFHIIKAQTPDHGLPSPLRAYPSLSLWIHFCCTLSSPAHSSYTFLRRPAFLAEYVCSRLITEQDSSPPTIFYSKVTLSLRLNTFLKIKN